MQLQEIADVVERTAHDAGGTTNVASSYPAWEPVTDSSLLARCSRVYSSLFGSEPIIEVIHAGLECGIIGAKCDGMEMISIGPTIKYPHCPDERLNLPSLEKLWEYFVALLASYGEPA